MLAVIRTKDGSDDTCYVTRLVPSEMGTYEDIKRRVHDASRNANFLSNSPQELLYSSTNITVDPATLSPKSATLCGDTPVVWLEKQPAEG